ncbi:TetR/AcrR family transcriptional regulator [Sinomonas cyclohexanicum]|uniref:TetR/AcrR family transcriptional regulator n=1 Tax=Sinomonas cyclohexanicum TaxID=322009 RepID=UPI001E5B616F|nr:TetR/AcrR family transcriptional regulator [Corynebacterium cyclohexanicum]
MSTRERVLEAAVGLLGTQGLRALTHARVDEAAGVPRGSASNYFRTRAALLGGVVEWIVEQEMGGQDAPGALPDTVEGFAGLLAGIVEQLTGPFRVRTTARYVLFLEGAHDDDVQRPLLAGRARFRALAEAGMAGLGAADPAVAATAVMAVCEGMIMHRIAVDPEAPVFAAIDGVVRAFSRAG